MLLEESLHHFLGDLIDIAMLFQHLMSFLENSSIRFNFDYINYILFSIISISLMMKKAFNASFRAGYKKRAFIYLFSCLILLIYYSTS